MIRARRTVSFLSIFALSAALAGCGDDDDDGPVGPVGGSSGAAGAAGGGGSAGGPAGGGGGGAGGAGAVGYDAISYDLRGSFDWARQRLVVSELITVKLADPKASTSVELDAVVEVKRVHAGGTDLPYVVDPAARKLRVDLSSLGQGEGERSFSVDYEAQPSHALLPYQGRDGDPVAARVVSTDSEPDDGVNWLVARHHPSDRALFRVELTVEPDEDVVANGARVADEAADGKRRVRYEMPQPIPTYLMAFAAGQLEHADRTTGRVPLSLWYRRGAPVEAEKHLDLLADLMGKLEARLGNYPWDRYAVVLLPQQPGGMENATITFNDEGSGQGEIGATLNAHELAHQWFGDWVTMRDYDDVWVKEGMATLLQVDAQRGAYDEESTGRLLGRTFAFNPDHAIVDRSLVGQAKYNSGPYSRAAWLITQIRAKVGEEAFWRSVKQVLADHALGDLDGPGFIRSFAPALDAASVERAIASLERKPPPALTFEATPAGAGTPLKLTLSDPSGALLAPLAITVVDAAGQPTSHSLGEGAPLEVVVPAGGYVAPDEGDVHPGLARSFLVESEQYYGAVAPLLWPSAPDALAAVGARSAAHQEVALNGYGLPPTVGPAQFGAFYDGLDSQRARSDAEFIACYALNGGGAPEAEWVAALAPVLSQPALLTFSVNRSYCGTTLATQAFGAEFAAASAALTAANAGRFSYLLSFDYGPEASFDAAARAATTAPSLQLRDRAVSRLVSQAEFDSAFTPVPAEQAPAWKAFFRDRLAESTSPGRFYTVWRGVRALADDAALVTAAQKLHAVPISNEQRREIVCDAFGISTGREGSWDEFRAAAQPWDTLGPEAAAALADPTVCAAEPPLRAARPSPLALAARRSPRAPAAFRAPLAPPALRALLDAPALRARGAAAAFDDP